MLYYSLVDIGEVSDFEIQLLRKGIESHFPDASALKRKDSVCAKAVLCRFLKEIYHMDSFTIEVSEKGKPYIPNSKIHFNLSHSGDLVLCVSGENEIGCDVEVIGEYRENIVSRYFSLPEQERLSLSENKEKDFTKLWTLKESILKYSGEGMSGGLSCYDFSEFLQRDSFESFGLHFESRIYDTVAMSICSKEKKLSQLNVDIKHIITNFEKKLKAQ